MNINEENMKQIKKYEDNINIEISLDKKLNNINDLFALQNLNDIDKERMNYFQTIAKSNNLSISTKISLETSFTQIVLKDYISNFQKSMNLLKFNLSNSAKDYKYNCNICISSKSTPQYKYTFKPNVNSFKILKDTLNQYRIGMIQNQSINNNKKNDNNHQILDNLLNKSLSISKKDSKFFNIKENTLLYCNSNNDKGNENEEEENKVIKENKNKNSSQKGVKISQISLVQNSKISKNSTFKVHQNWNKNGYMRRHSLFNSDGVGVNQVATASQNNIYSLNSSNNMKKYENIDDKIKEINNKLSKFTVQ